MVDDAVTFMAALLWVMTAVETIAVVRRRHADPTLNMLGITFALLAVSATFFMPAVYLATGRLTGSANLAEPIARTALMGAAWSVQLLLRYLAGQPGVQIRTDRSIVVLTAFLAALWTCFAIAPVGKATVMFTRDYGTQPIVAAYLLTCLTYLALALINVIRNTHRYRRAARHPLATALGLIGLGCWFGLGYVGVKVTFVVLLGSGHGTSDATIESSAGRLLAVCGAVLLAAGASLPYLVARTGRVRDWIVTYRDLRGLYPLWALMHHTTPAIALDPPRSRLGDALRVTDLELRRYRRVVEIRDGCLALAPYRATTTCSTQLGDVEHNAAREAAMLVRAAHRKLSGWPAASILPAREDGPDTLDDDIAWLTRVADHLTSPPRALPRQAEHSPADSPTARTVS